MPAAISPPSPAARPQPITLACTDFDGTLVLGTPNADDLIAWRDALASLRRRWRTRWAVVTGRPLEDLLPLLGLFTSYALFPDYVVVADALIFKRDAVGRFRPFRLWNLRIAWRRHSLFRRHANRVSQWRDRLLADFPGGTDCSRQPVDIWVTFRHEAMAMQAEIQLREWAEETGGFEVFRWGREVFLAPSAGNKGEAVARLARHLDLPLSQVFAIGDGPNDLPMLRRGAVGLPACVGNASERVKEVVAEAAGYVATGEVLAGVLEAVRFYARP